MPINQAPMTIAGCGCALGDFVYSPVDFSAPAFQQLRSRVPGDGGLTPGQLVFQYQLERYAGRPVADFLPELVRGASEPAFNVGGPAIIALALMAQVLPAGEFEVAYHGAHGRDDVARRILDLMRQTPLRLDHYIEAEGETPYTLVLSDPAYDGGHGERTFVNHLGVAADYQPAQLAPEFLSQGLINFGATALVPPVHAALGGLVRRARQAGAFTVVTTVFDFLNEVVHQGQRWPLGEDEPSWPWIDLLICDHDEALRLSGSGQIDAACAFFEAKQLAAYIITNGPNPIRLRARGGSRFRPAALQSLPVSDAVLRDVEACRRGDTTGCGDNFAGGVMADLAVQLRAGGELDLARAVAVGICAGGSARFQLGGLAREAWPGQRREQLARLYRDYRSQLAGTLALPELDYLAMKQGD